MQEASYRLLAVFLAVIIGAGGCTLRPESYSAGFKLPWAKGGSGLIPGSPADVSTMPSGSAMAASKADPVSLASKPKPSAGLHVAAGRLAEQAGKVAEAEQHYQKALEIDPQDADALVGYARLKDRQGQMAEAIRLYERAAKAHPKNASIFNDLGLCLARHRKFDESIAALERAVQLDPKKWLYRNNIAMVLIETGRVDDAVSHLRAVQDEAVAHYNVGYILQKKGDREAAAAHFAEALYRNPSLAEAKTWLEKLAREPASIADPSPRIARERQLNNAPIVSRDEPAPLQRDPRRSAAARAAPLPQTVPETVGAGVQRPNVWQPLPGAERSPLPDPRPDRPRPGPAYSNVAPLPSPTSIREAPQRGEPNRSGIPAVLPLPPVTAAENVSAGP